MVEHVHTIEERKRSRHWKGGDVVELQTRYVCSCGFATRWQMDHRKAEREIDRHAVDGQLSLL